MAVNESLLVILTAAIPVVELRGAIPLGLAMGMPLGKVWLLSLIGNILPIPFILLGLNMLMEYLHKIPRIHQWIEARGHSKAKKLYHQFQRWGWLALYIFVAIPLPGTGAWSGALAATLLQLKFWPSLVTITLGVATAGLLVSGLGAGILTIFNIYV